MPRITKQEPSHTPLTFEQTVGAIAAAHLQLAAQAGKAVNLALTLRNWLIGGYIQEYEQAGSDRAKYGAHLLEAIAEQLSSKGVAGVAVRSLRLYRQFYLAYPTIRQTVSAELHNRLPDAEKWQTASAESADQTLQPCAHKDHALLEYAMAGMDNQLFVSRYQLELPSKETLEKFIEQHLKAL